ncbi:MAG: hypothetical protein AVDCRST_MAG85-669 [uncultured Solirubrobacteraceae bacterium]|uniref:Uncharacterized protein n=1 Tax=uncultured Solirubrobacteraceae bacterium TaxID=1162706 RepID=A0A6J4RSH3_9ACTN|nr:MAG: hypothetical protein AVDCRST_MAG85-669 [uncultured Solirubrobacteraceae bacterium]
MNRQSLLWSLVVFFGAGLLFNAVNDATEGEAVGLRILAQVVTLAVVVAVITVIVRSQTRD